MAKTEIEIVYGWVKTPPDMSKCIICEEIIYSQINIFVISANNTKTNTSIKLCDSCHEAQKSIISL